MGEDDDDLRSAIESAVRETSPDPKPEPSTREPSAPAPETPSSDRARDDHGRFAPKPAEQAEPTAKEPDATTKAPETAPAATRRAPQSWTKDAADLFPTLPPAIQDQILKREADVTNGFARRDDKIRIADGLEQIVAPHRQMLTALGIDPFAALDEALRFRAIFERNPADLINHLAQLAQQRRPGAFPQPAPAASPMEQRLGRLEAYLQGQAAQERQRQAASIQNDLAEFARSAPHFAVVEEAMAKLIRSGLATNLKDAYDRATWSDPAIREQLQAERAAPAAAQAQAASDQARVARARQAGGSVRGAPGGTAPAAPERSLREEIEAQFAR